MVERPARIERSLKSTSIYTITVRLFCDYGILDLPNERLSIQHRLSIITKADPEHLQPLQCCFVCEFEIVLVLAVLCNVQVAISSVCGLTGVRNQLTNVLTPARSNPQYSSSQLPLPSHSILLHCLWRQASGELVRTDHRPVRP